MRPLYEYLTVIGHQAGEHTQAGQPLHAHVTLEKGERSELADLASSLL